MIWLLFHLSLISYISAFISFWVFLFFFPYVLVVTTFFSTLGPLIFPVWRAILLGKRILICGQPPLRRLSYIVYAASLLSKNTVKLNNWNNLNSANPLFYVNISTDADTLQNEV